MKFLVAIPFLHGAEHSRLAIESVINSNDTDLLLIDNGADNDVKAVLNLYHSRDNVTIISNEVNVYVNPAWNQALSFFGLNNEYSHIIIMNSDLIMRDDWNEVLKKFISENANYIPVPVLSNNIHTPDTDNEDYSLVYSSTAGVFIVLNRIQASLIYPIPQEIRVWFGDNWIYDQLRGMGYVTAIPNNLHAYHYNGGSQNVSKDRSVAEVIEQDKVNWANSVEPAMRKRVAEFFHD